MVKESRYQMLNQIVTTSSQPKIEANQIDNHNVQKIQIGNGVQKNTNSRHSNDISFQMGQADFQNQGEAVEYSQHRSKQRKSIQLQQIPGQILSTDLERSNESSFDIDKFNSNKDDMIKKTNSNFKNVAKLDKKFNDRFLLSESSFGNSSDDSQSIHYEQMSTSESDLSDEDNFDIDKFRNQKEGQNKVQQTKNKKQKSSTKVQKIQKYYYFLNIKFITEYLLERNKNPDLLLKSIVFCMAVYFLSYFFIQFFGCSARILPYVFLASYIPLFSYFISYLLKMSVRQSIKITPKLLVFSVIICINPSALILYWFIWDVPFNSVGIFLISLQLCLIFGTSVFAQAMTPNTTNFEDLNYQFRFCFSRIIISLINSMGLVDVLSDIALGLELIKLNKIRIFLIFGVFLCLMCLLDFIILCLRIMNLIKVGVRFHAVAIFLEMCILGITILVFVYTKKVFQNENTDLDLLLYLSLFTTVVNFFHHIFVIFETINEKKQSQSGINMSVLFA